MTIAYFLEIVIPREYGDRLRASYRDAVVPKLLGNPAVLSVHLYAPDHGERPANNDQCPPEVVLQFNVAKTQEIDTALSNGRLTEFFPIPETATASHDVFETLHYTLPGYDEPSVRRAPLSFGVRYYRPISDETAFVGHYLTHHPQLLAEMPKVRNVLCYKPVPWGNPNDIPHSNCIIGNEVVFDTFEDLVAMQLSSEIERVRADTAANPVKPGPSTHFAYRREDYFPLPRS